MKILYVVSSQIMEKGETAHSVSDTNKHVVTYVGLSNLDAVGGLEFDRIHIVSCVPNEHQVCFLRALTVPIYGVIELH